MQFKFIKSSLCIRLDHFTDALQAYESSKDHAINHITTPIMISKTFQAFGFSNTGSSNLAPKPKLKKKTNDAVTAPAAKAALLAY